jgi:hypothetical protein
MQGISHEGHDGTNDEQGARDPLAKERRSYGHFLLHNASVT